MNDRPRILVDGENITYLVASALELAGMETATAATRREVLAPVAGWRLDAVVLDVMLPDLDGFPILRRPRDQGQMVPAVFLTARNTIEDRVRGLSDGGEDYLVKPFEVAELVGRVKPGRRRSDDPTRSHRLRCADLEMDTERHEVIRAGRSVHLSSTESKLLHYLLVNSGHDPSRVQILDQAWSYDFQGGPPIVDTYVGYLRRKVDDVTPKMLHTVRSVRFSLRVDETRIRA